MVEAVDLPVAMLPVRAMRSMVGWVCCGAREGGGGGGEVGGGGGDGGEGEELGGLL